MTMPHTCTSLTRREARKAVENLIELTQFATDLFQKKSQNISDLAVCCDFRTSKVKGGQRLIIGLINLNYSIRQSRSFVSVNVKTSVVN